MHDTLKVVGLGRSDYVGGSERTCGFGLLKCTKSKWVYVLLAPRKGIIVCWKHS